MKNLKNKWKDKEDRLWLKCKNIILRLNKCKTKIMIIVINSEMVKEIFKKLKSMRNNLKIKVETLRRLWMSLEERVIYKNKSLVKSRDFMMMNEERHHQMKKQFNKSMHKIKVWTINLNNYNHKLKTTNKLLINFNKK